MPSYNKPFSDKDMEFINSLEALEKARVYGYISEEKYKELKIKLKEAK